MFEIKEESFIEWKYVPTKENPADLESRGCEITAIDDKRWELSKWRQDQTQWSEQPKIKKRLATTFTLYKTCLIRC